MCYVQRFYQTVILEVDLYVSNMYVLNKYAPNKLLKLTTGVNIPHFNANMLYFVKSQFHSVLDGVKSSFLLI